MKKSSISEPFQLYLLFRASQPSVQFFFLKQLWAKIETEVRREEYMIGVQPGTAKFKQHLCQLFKGRQQIAEDKNLEARSGAWGGGGVRQEKTGRQTKSYNNHPEAILTLQITAVWPELLHIRTTYCQWSSNHGQLFWPCLAATPRVTDWAHAYRFWPNRRHVQCGHCF